MRSSSLLPLYIIVRVEERKIDSHQCVQPEEDVLEETQLREEERARGLAAAGPTIQNIMQFVDCFEEDPPTRSTCSVGRLLL